MTWRQYTRPIVRRILSENRGKSIKEIRRALREAYPFGERKYWPYFVWCSEIRIQLGLSPDVGRKKEIPENQINLDFNPTKK